MREWMLANAEQRVAESPATFKIPSRKARDNLNPGMLVKLIFEFADPNLRKDGIEAEECG